MPRPSGQHLVDFVSRQTRSPVAELALRDAFGRNCAGVAHRGGVGWAVRTGTYDTAGTGQVGNSLI